MNPAKQPAIKEISTQRGYDISDYVLKLAWETDRQSLLFKAQHSEESSDETYLGLTDANFDSNPDRRYGLSEPDVMNNDHDGYSLVYRLQLADNVGLSATGYYNKFSRNWFSRAAAAAML